MPLPDKPTGAPPRSQAQTAAEFDPAVLLTDPSKLKAQLISGLALLAFAGSFSVAVVGFLRRGQYAELVTYLQGNETVTGLAALSGLAIFVQRLIAARRRKEKEIALNVTSSVGTLSKPVVAAEGSVLASAIVAAAQNDKVTAAESVQQAIDTGAVQLAPAVAAAIDVPVDPRPPHLAPYFAPSPREGSQAQDPLQPGQRADTPVMS